MLVDSKEEADLGLQVSYIEDVHYFVSIMLSVKPCYWPLKSILDFSRIFWREGYRCLKFMSRKMSLWTAR